MAKTASLKNNYFFRNPFANYFITIIIISIVVLLFCEKERKMSENKEMNDIQKETFNELCRFYDVSGRPPTLKELSGIMKTPISSIQYQINMMIEKGYLVREGRGTKTIKIIRRLPPSDTKMIAIPLIGEVVAGSPCIAEERRKGFVFLEKYLPHPEECFALRANGESMIKTGIHPGDILVARQQSVAANGEIVIAVLNGESTVKRLEYKPGSIRLIPENDCMKPIPVHASDSFVIHGVVLFWKSVCDFMK